MCRLFAMSAAPHRVHATFWLLDAPDSLSLQSRREPDGTGLGTFTERDVPLVEKQPIAAYEDREFATESRERVSRTFLAHIRFASTGGLDPRNTHPFEIDGRLFAHNGVLGDLELLERELGPYRDRVRGDTDSERFFALVTRRIDEHDGDVGAGLAAAARWVADHVPVYALNVIVTTATELWALRYPETHRLFVLERAAGGDGTDRSLVHTGGGGRVRAHSDRLADLPAVVVASEPMDDDPGWTELASGELLHVDGALSVRRTRVLDTAPARLIDVADLGERAAASQRET